MDQVSSFITRKENGEMPRLEEEYYSPVLPTHSLNITAAAVDKEDGCLDNNIIVKKRINLNCINATTVLEKEHYVNNNTEEEEEEHNQLGNKEKERNLINNAAMEKEHCSLVDKNIMTEKERNPNIDAAPILDMVLSFVDWIDSIINVSTTVGVGGDAVEDVVEATQGVINQVEAASIKQEEEEATLRVREIGPYETRHKILLVGEGDFSFSASLAATFGYAFNIVATSLNDKDFLMRNYRKAMANIEELENRGALVVHCVDATTMAKRGYLRGLIFDRIVFNFPHTGYFGYTESDIRLNQKLVRRFLRNAKTMIVEDGGEIHVTNKTSSFFMKWDIAQLGLREGLNLLEEVPFHHTVYPGYRTKYGFGGDNNFHCYPSNTYKFELLKL